MSWSNGTWTRIVATSADIMLAGWIWRQYDVTISAHCGLELRKPRGNWVLRGLGRALNWMSAGHCEGAIAADIARAKSAISFLGG